MDIHIEKTYLNLFFNLQKLQWENYVQGAKHDLSSGDKELHLFLDKIKGFQTDGRRGQVLTSIIHRGLVDKHPDVAELRNRLDDRGNYSGKYSVALSELARLMRPDVLKLMEIRNQLAKDLGYDSYIKLVMASEELEIGQISFTIEQFLGIHLERARALVKAHDIKWQSWFSDYNRLGHPLALDAVKVAEDFVTTLGLGIAMSNISLTVLDQPIHGIACALNVPGDIRILVRPVTSLARLLTLYHELGHGLSYALNTQQGLFKTWTAVHDETCAIIMERIGLELLPNRDLKCLARDMILLENVRSALSFQFEIDLNTYPHQADELYNLHYCRLIECTGDNSLWPLDSFRSIDPVYIHNYVIGSIIAQNTVNWLKCNLGSNPVLWGGWLRENLFAPGRSHGLGCLESLIVVE